MSRFCSDYTLCSSDGGACPAVTVGLIFAAVFLSAGCTGEPAQEESSSGGAVSRLQISDAQAQRIGQRIWQNESGGSYEGLTAWNEGENFPSLGIGHFIWYPAGVEGPFEESFPKLVRYLQARGANVPEWVLQNADCPWPNRAAFMADFDGERLSGLRAFLNATVAEQARFAALRLEGALPKMKGAAGAGQAAEVERRFYVMASQPAGVEVMVDYVNFKGEGTNPSERYNGEGWGLMQVLLEMEPPFSTATFGAAADRVLTRRVENSPPERNEKRWLQGWRNRVWDYENW